MSIEYLSGIEICYQQIYYIPIRIMKTDAYVTGKGSLKVHEEGKEIKREWRASQEKAISAQEKIFL